MEPIVTIENIQLRREGKIILRNVSWQINKGEHWAFIGKNGSGKTMTLKVITGYQWPTHGSVEVLGHRFGTYDLRELRKEIGWVSLDLQFQFQRAFPALDVVLSGYFASIGLFEKPPQAVINKALQLLRFLECPHIVDRPFHLLSYGEQKRIIIARGLITDPKLLILDEPCTGLDLVAREHFLETVQKLGQKKNGPTIIFVTHHIEEIMPFITHCHCIKDGLTFKQGRKETVLTSTLLSDALGMQLKVMKSHNRYWTQIATKKI